MQKEEKSDDNKETPTTKIEVKKSKTPSIEPSHELNQEKKRK